jgi:hypothetical protein
MHAESPKVSDIAPVSSDVSPKGHPMNQVEFELRIAEEITAIVREAVCALREHGLKRAYELAARMLGLNPRRVRAYWHGEVRAIPAYEAEQIRSRNTAMLRAELARLQAKRETLELRLRALEEHS